MSQVFCFFTRTTPDDQILSARVKNQNYEILNNKMNEMLQLCLFGFIIQKQKCVYAQLRSVWSPSVMPVALKTSESTVLKSLNI